MAIVRCYRYIERQLRAYVVVTCKDLIFQGSSHERFIVRLEAINTGQTPAYQLQIRSATDAIVYPVQANFDFPLEQLSAEPGIFTLGAGLAIDHDSIATRVLDQNEIVKSKVPIASEVYITMESLNTSMLSERSDRRNLLFL